MRYFNVVRLAVSLKQLLVTSRASALIALAIGVFSGAVSNVSAETLKVATYLHPSTLSVNSLNRLAQEIAKETGGALELKIYPSGNLVERRELFNSVRFGNADIVLLPISGVPGGRLFSIPYAVSGNNQIRSALKSNWGKKKLARTVFLDSWYHSNAYIYSHEKQLRQPDDFKGLEALSASRTGMQLLGWLGTKPSAVPFNTLMQNIDKVAIINIEFLWPNTLKDRTGFLMKTNHRVFSNILLANEAKFSELPNNRQETLVRLARKIGYEHDLAKYAQEEKIFSNFIEQGGKVVDGVAASLREATSGSVSDEVKKAEEEEGYNLASAHNGCTSTSECKCKSGNNKCRCSKKCKNNSNCK